MKLGMFTTAESYAKWHNDTADLFEANGLRMAKESLAKAKANNGADFLAMNPLIPDERKAEAVANYIKFLEGDVKRIERKIKKYRRLAQKALAEA